ncbi:MAG TPA: cobalamin-dependent protein [Bacillota bacterium]|nr:cobalamin-dependent protein [Bacillota bacterium]HPZ59010.1 cobalamin-dependent protein [Bacillota bacterium]HQC82695.1 cobalamin-dependent protein [Bacillota bacterium]
MDLKERLMLAAKVSIIQADEKKAMEVIDEAIAHGLDLAELLRSGFGKGNTEVGNSFERGRISLPELLYSSEVMRDVTERVMSFLEGAVDNNGKILIATVEGDIHDIGKNIVASTLRAAGFQVIDLGREVPVNQIIETAEKYDVDIIATSALLTTTLVEQRKLEIMLRDLGLRGKYTTMIGGAPCTPRWKNRIGADIYSEDAIEAVKSAKKAMEEKRRKK